MSKAKNLAAVTLAAFLLPSVTLAQTNAGNDPERHTVPSTGNSKNAFPKVVIRSTGQQTASENGNNIVTNSVAPTKYETEASAADQHAHDATSEGNASYVYRSVKASPNPKDNFYKIVRVPVEASAH